MRQFYWFLATLFFGVPAILLSLFAIGQVIILPKLGYVFDLNTHIVIYLCAMALALVLALPTSFCSHRTQQQVW